MEAMLALYADGSEVGNVNAPEKFTGREGAREFWTKYRDTFGEVRSTFRNRIITDTSAALEWTTAGTTAGGAPFNYEGVSILEIEGDCITRFRAYFDPEALGRQIERAAAGR
jgi:ketosteroid isomerase-like protein